LRRTFPGESDKEKIEREIIPLRNVLTAYV
jgi:hypothetical protein